MGLRIQALTTGVILTFVSAMASALGLGEIRVNSALNQPLDAEIELLQIRSLTEEDLYVGLATPEAFAQAGVDRTSNVLDLNFRADFDAAQGPIIKVTSSRPIKEPFVNFLVEARWPSGRMLREYTLLMDLPVFTGERSAPVAPSQSTSRTSPVESARSTPPASARPTSQTRPAQPTRTTPAIEGDSYGPVKASDTLWNIASRVRPDQSVSVQQTMLALQRMNPNAFINNNINLLRRGQVLRVPDLEEINRLGARDAIREVSMQNRNWNSRGTEYEQEAAQLEGSRSYTSSSTDTEQPEGRLKLSSRDSFSDTESGRGAGEGEGSEAIENALAATQEQLDATRRENSELRERLKAMEEQVQTMEKLLQVSSEEMRALELSSSEVNDQQAEAIETGSGMDQDNAETLTDGTPETADAEVADPSAEQVEVGETAVTEPEVEAAASDSKGAQVDQAQTEASPTTPPQPAAPAGKPTIMDLIMANILYIGIGVGALLLAIIAMIFLRRGRDEYEDDAFDEMEPQFVSPDTPAEDTTVVAYANEESASTENWDQFGTEEADVTAEAETEDVVAESDIHIAYGQYDQAEEKLIRALETDPASTAVRLKLLEVLAAQNAAAEFDNHYAKVNDSGDTAAIAKAEALRQSIDGIGPYTGPSASLEDDDASYNSDTLEYDYPEPSSDDTLAFNEEQATHASADELASEDAFEFELDEAQTTGPEEGEDDATVTLTESEPDYAQRLEISEDPESGGDDDTRGGEGDFEFDLEGSDIDMDLNDLELDVDMGDFDQDSDTPGQNDEELTSEFSSPATHESEPEFTPEPMDSSDWQNEDTSLADVQDSEDRPWENTSGDQTAENDEFSVPLAYDANESPDEDSPNEEDNGDFAFESAQPDSTGESMSEPETSFDEFYGEADGSDGNPDESSSTAKDFESDVDLEGEVNLDALDQELDQLSSGWKEDGDAVDDAGETDVTASDDVESAAPVAEVDKEILSGDAVDESELDLTDTQADNADSDMDFEIPDFDPEEDDDSNLGFLTDSDETATKLDLARAYIDMGDADGAKDILDEIMEEGDDTQKREAETLLAKIG